MDTKYTTVTDVDEEEGAEIVRSPKDHGKRCRKKANGSMCHIRRLFALPLYPRLIVGVSECDAVFCFLEV